MLHRLSPDLYFDFIPFALFFSSKELTVKPLTPLCGVRRHREGVTAVPDRTLAEVRAGRKGSFSAPFGAPFLPLPPEGQLPRRSAPPLRRATLLAVNLELAGSKPALWRQFMKYIKILPLVLFTCVVSVQWAQAGRKPQYTVQDLGTLGGSFSVANGLANSGWVLGHSAVPGDTAVHAFLWRNGLTTDLGTLGGPDSLALYRPNENGVAGGGSETTTPDPLGENWCVVDNVCLPFLWRNGTMIPLPTLGGNNGFAQGVNDQVEVVGTAENAIVEPTCAGTGQVLQYKPVIWKKGKVHELPTFAGDPTGGAHAINDRGQAVGNSGPCNAASHALLWEKGVVIDLGNLGGTMENVAFDINNQGRVVGLSDLSGDTVFHAFLWGQGAMTDLGTLPGDVLSAANSINQKDQVVGWSVDAYGNERPFFWQNGVMKDLNTLTDPNSPLYLIEAHSINDRGQIVGYALVKATGELHAFLATPSHGEAFSEDAAPSEPSQRPKVTLPESIRKLLEQRARFGGFKGGLFLLQ